MMTHLTCLQGIASAKETTSGLDGATGNIFKVDLENRSFELLKETEYDPKSEIGRSRFTVHWTERTTITRVEQKSSFEGIKGPVLTNFQGIDAANSKALQKREAFVARVATVFTDAPNAAAPETENQVAGLFTPDAGDAPRGGKIMIDGKPVRVSLRANNSLVHLHTAMPAENLAAGIWKATLKGHDKGGRFIIDTMEITPLPDPRKTDDPKLPRVLVIGDSISMNYHDAAKAALKGVANYHRNEGNAASTVQGVRNLDLWLGDHQEKGLHWDVIQFNHGLHDLKQGYDASSDKFGGYMVSLEGYKRNLEQQIAVLKKTGARLIWCSTTPVPNDNKGPYARRKGASAEFNHAALEVMRGHPDILITDLHQVVEDSPVFDNWRKGTDVHFYKTEEQNLLGKAVAATIRKALAKPGGKAAIPKAGADQSTPALAQYFSWINNTNEGTTEEQTLANLGFFQWLQDEYGMILDIYAFDAGFVDGKKFTAIMSESERFKKQFPQGLDRVFRTASKMGTRLGHWGGPDGFGDTPESEQARIDMMTGLCRDYNWALYKFDLVCGDLRPEKEQAFIRMMKESRVHSPDLIALNHRLPLGEEGLSLMTTSLWDGQETYVDVHVGNSTTAPHHRAGVMSRGNTENFNRLLEDHGVCISSCIDHYDDDMILQAFGRNLILAPEVYGNPWLLRDDEFPKFARIFNLARRHREILIHANALPQAAYGPNAVSRGDGATRFITLRNLTWEPVTYAVSLDREIGLEPADKVELRQFHPTEKLLGSHPFGAKHSVTVQPFRACLLIATTGQSSEIGVSGCDYEVVRDKADRPAVVRLLGMPGTTAEVTLVSGGREFSKATLGGVDTPDFAEGGTVKVRFEGTPLKQPWHRKLAAPKAVQLPDDAEALYEATCFAADNNALETRSLARSGETEIPAVKAARDAFFNQRVFVGRGLWDRYMFDGDPATSFHVSKRWKVDPRVTPDAPLRVDFGEAITADRIELIIPDQYSLQELFEGEGGFVAEVSADLKSWTRIPFIHGEENNIPLPAGMAVRYLRIPGFSYRISEMNAYAGGKALPRAKWRASNLFGSYANMKFTKAWSGGITLEEAVKGGYLCVALNGKHGLEGAYAAIRTRDGRHIGAFDRATSFPSNPWEFVNSKRDGNYTYYFRITPDMIGAEMEVVVLAGDLTDETFLPEVWQTAHAAPFVEQILILDDQP